MELDGRMRIWVVASTAIYILLSTFVITSQGQRAPLPPPPMNNQPQPLGSQMQGPPMPMGSPPPPQPQMNSNGSMTSQSQHQVPLAQTQISDGTMKDDSIKRILKDLATVQTQSQMKDTLAGVANLVGPLFYANFEQRKDQIIVNGRNASQFSQRLLTAVTDTQSEEVKALLLQKKLDSLHVADFGFLPLAIQYALQPSVLSTLSGTKLASAMRANPGDTNLAYKTASALVNRPDQQTEYLQSLGSKIFPDVQRIIINQVIQWWGNANQWKDRELSLLTTSGDPLLAYLPLSELEKLDEDMADRFTSILGQANDIGKVWWMKPMGLQKAWFELAKRARYFGAVNEWSFRRLQKLSFLLEGASPEDLKMVPPIPEIKGLVIANRYTELQSRVVFDAFFQKVPLSQEDLQECQYHVLNLIPVQLQRFDLADSFSTLDEMMTLLDQQKQLSYATVLQISYFMWPLVNTTNGDLAIAPPQMWQKRELSQMGKLLFLLPKSILFQIPAELINWDSNILQAIRSSQLSLPQIWHLTALILSTIDDRFKPDYTFMMPSPFQQGIPTYNMSQVLLASPNVRPEVLRALIEESSGTLTSQQAVIFQRIRLRLTESAIIRNILSSARPSELFRYFNPRVISKNMPTIIKTIMEMPETGRFGIISIQAKLLPRSLLSLWLNWVKENAQVNSWTAEDILGRSALGAAHEINLAVLGLSCRDINIIDPLDILTVILYYRHELYNLQKYEPDLNFNLNLRTCLLEKVLDYLRLKSTLNGNQSDSHILTELNDGEITAIGGEILTAIPTAALQPVPLGTQMEILEEIGRVEMMELFSMCTLPQLIWYGNTLLRGIKFSQVNNVKSLTKRQLGQSEIEPPQQGLDGSSGVSQNPTQQDKVLNMNALFFETMGNLLCYASDLEKGNWSKSLFRDMLESKQLPGSKTCCMHGHTRGKLFTLLQEAYGPDTTSWRDDELASIGDLLIVVPEQDLAKISLDSLSKAFNPIMKQSGFEIEVRIPGPNDKISFMKSCVEKLGTEGPQYHEAYKSLMRRYFQAAQWLVNTVKTTNELIKDGIGRGGRVPRWAEFKLVRTARQIPIATGVPQSNPTFAATPSAFSTNYGNQQSSGVLLTFPQPMQTGSLTSDPSMQQFQQFSPSSPTTPMISYTQNAQTTPMLTPTYITSSPVPSYQMVPNAAPSLQQGQQTYYASTYNPNVQSSYVVAPAPAITYQVSYSPATVPNDQLSSNFYNYNPAPLSPLQILGSQQVSNTPQFQNTQQYPAVQLQYPAVQQQYPAVQQQYPAVQQQYPAVQQQYPAVQQQYPAVQQQYPAVQQQYPAVQQQYPAVQQQYPAVQQQYPVVQQQYPAVQQQYPAVQQQYPVTQNQPQNPTDSQQGMVNTNIQQLPPQQFSPSQQDTINAQQFLNQQLVQNTQIQQQGNQQQLANNQAQNTQQQLSNNQQIPPNQIGNQQGEILTSSQNFGQTPGQGVPGFNVSPDGTFITNTNQPLLPRSVDATEQQSETKALNVAVTKENIPLSMTVGNMQKAEAGQQPEITCHGIKAARFAAIGLTIDDLKKLPAVDLFNCVEDLGKIDWDENMKGDIVSLMKERRLLTANNVDTLTLLEMGNLVTALTILRPDVNLTTTDEKIFEISQLDMTLPKSLDTLSILGSRTVDQSALQTLAEKFNADNKIFPGFAQGIARPDNLRIAVMALQNIICGFNDKIVNSIFETDASLFLDVSYVLGRLKGCSLDVLTTLATHAVRASNYGPPRLWSQEDVEIIGVVFAGLKPEAVATIPALSMQGLLPHAMSFVSPEIFKAFTPEQLEKLTFSSASAITFAQMNVLTDIQRAAVNSVLVPQSSEFDVPLEQLLIHNVQLKLPMFRSNETTAEVSDVDEHHNVHLLIGRSGEVADAEDDIETTTTPGPTVAEDMETTTTVPPPPLPSSVKSHFSYLCTDIVVIIVFVNLFLTNVP